MGEVMVGAELIATRRTQVRLGTFFETWLSGPGGALRRSLGRDEYHLALTVGRGQRLAATARTYICQLDLAKAGLGQNQAAEANLVEAAVGAGSPLVLGVRTNQYLDLSQLAEGVALTLIADGQALGPVPLTDRRLWCDEVGPGRFLIECGNLLP